jgi:replicative DNA helicase
VRLGQLLDEWRDDAQAAFDARTKGIARGPVTGLARLDTILGGVLQPGLHIVHGGAGVGKTALALQVAATCGAPAMYVGCEMRLLELFRRVAARTTGTFLGRLKDGSLHPDDSLELARRACGAAPELVLADATQAFADFGWLHTAAVATQGEAKHVLVVVDSLHSWAEGAPGALTEYDALNGAIATLRSLAGVLGCPILAVAERNRVSMQRGGLSASAGSRKFEYGSESVVGLTAEPRKTAPPAPPGEVGITLRVEKNRSGAAGQEVDVFFHGALQRFREP